MEDCRMNPTPRVLLFTGDGKGKTTAALGMVLRAIGHGMKVCVVQFIKGDPSVGEIAALKAQDIEVIQTGLGFVPKPESPRFADHRAAAEDGLQKVGEVLAEGRFSMVVLDEICPAIERGLLDEAEVLTVLRRARPDTCLVLTGRHATAGLIDLADTVTEMRPLKHALENGRGAEKGVER
jgi:cob(I)alamin adenosyltransferase